MSAIRETGTPPYPSMPLRREHIVIVVLVAIVVGRTTQSNACRATDRQPLPLRRTMLRLAPPYH